MCYSGSADNHFCFIIEVWVTKDTGVIGRDLVVFALVFPQTAVQTKCNQVFFHEVPVAFWNCLPKEISLDKLILNLISWPYFTLPDVLF